MSYLIILTVEIFDLYWVLPKSYFPTEINLLHLPIAVMLYKSELKKQQKSNTFYFADLKGDDTYKYISKLSYHGGTGFIILSP